MSRPNAIETASLTKAFGNLIAVDRLDLRVPAGSIFGLLGPNGAGKTTTFSMICGFIKPSSGSATVLGHSLKDFPFSSGRLSALPQDARFHPDRTVMDSMVFLGRLCGLSKEQAAARTLELLKAVDLADAAGMKGGHLSHGMAKRFGIAQAFLGSPELVLLDEPTAGLDPRNAFTIRQMIRTLSGSATVVVSSHNLAEVQDLCTHAAIINKGKLVSSGSMSEMTSQDQQLLITISNLDQAMIERIGALPGVSGVSAGNGNGELRITFRANVDQTADQAVSQIVSGAIGVGAAISGVKRGQDLEQRYLEVT